MGKKTTSLEYVTTGQAALILGVSVRQVQNYIRREVDPLPARKIDARTYLIRRADLEMFQTRPVGRPAQKKSSL
jgi:hypothetical protein